MKKQLMSGTGMSEHVFDRDNKIVTIDFSGQSTEGCYRNDASVVFFAANSYMATNYALRDEIKRRFEENYREKDIEHLIMPFFFSFRHAVELFLKGLIVSISGTSPKDTHKLQSLLDALDSLLKSLKKPSDSHLNEKAFDDQKTVILSVFHELSAMINNYGKREVSEEYYRYIFGLDKNKEFLLTETKLSLDYSTTSEEFNRVFNMIYKLCKTLREADIYIYFTL